MAFEDAGVGRCCAFLHGFGEGRYVWAATTRLWAGRALAIDLPGHGDSDWRPDADYSGERHAASVSQLLERVAPEPILLVGHSMGADVALRLAAALPDRIAGLVLVDHSLVPVELASRQVGAEFREADRIFGSVENFSAWLAERRPAAGRELIAELAPRALRAMPGGGFVLKRDPALLAARTAEGRNRDGLRMLAELSMPVLVARGRMSSFLSADAARMAAEIARHGTVITIARAGHAVMLDDPGGLADALDGFADHAFAVAQTGRLAPMRSGIEVAGERGQSSQRNSP